MTGLDDTLEPLVPDEILQDRVNRLFEHAAEATYPGTNRPRFTTVHRGALSKQEVLAVFGALKTNYSSWRTGKLNEKGKASLNATRLMIRILTGTCLAEDVDRHEDATLIFDHLSNNHAEDLKDAVRRLREYEGLLEAREITRHKRRIDAKPTPAPDTFPAPPARPLAEPAIAPFALAPPQPENGAVPRPALRAELKQAAAQASVVRVEGAHGSGKRDLLARFSADSEGYNQILWWTATQGSTLQDLLGVIGTQVPSALPGDSTKAWNLVHWLERTGALLVIEAFEQADRESYNQLVGFARSRSGPARLVLASAEQTRDSNADVTVVFVEGLTRPEAKELLHKRGLPLEESYFEALMEATGGNPYLLNVAIDGPTDVRYLKDGFPRTDEAELWLRRTLRNFSDLEVEVLQHLALSEEAFDKEMIRWLADRTSGAIQTQAFVERLEQPFLLRRETTGSCRVREPLGSILRTLIPAPSLPRMYAALGDYLLQPWKNQPFPRSPEPDVVLRLAAACRYLQRAGTRDKEANDLLQHLHVPLRTSGLLRLLVPLLQRDIQRKGRPSSWSEYKLANLFIATGEAGAAYDILASISPLILDPSGNETLRLSIVRSFADLLLYVGEPERAEALLSGMLRIVPRRNLQMGNLHHARATLVSAYLGCGRIEEAIKANGELLGFTPESDKIGRAVCWTRRGIARLKQSRPDKAIPDLVSARDGFRQSDKRGLVWSSLYLAQALHLAGRTAEMEPPLLEAVVAILDHGFVGEDYCRLLRAFEPDIGSEELRILVNQTLAALQPKEEKRKLIPEQIARIDKFIALIGEVDGAEDETRVGVKLKAPPREVRSGYYRTYIRNLLKTDPLSYIEKMFSNHSKVTIFTNFLLSTILIEACKKRREIALAFLINNIEQIPNKDLMKVLYANCFVDIGFPDQAAQIAKSMNHTEGFDFHLLMARASRDFEAAEFHCNQALSLAERPFEEAGALLAKASALYSHEQEARYPEAASLCRQGLKLRQGQLAREFRGVLVTVEIETCAENHIKQTVDRLRTELDLSVAAMKRALYTVRDRIRRHAALGVLETLGA